MWSWVLHPGFLPWASVCPLGDVKVSHVSPGFPRLEFWGVVVPEDSGWFQEEWGLDWGSWHTARCLLWALGQGRLCVAPHPSPVWVSVSQVLFALCSLLRHFPYAQQQFLKLGGLQVLRSLVQEKGTEVLAVRVVTLLYDLVTEKVSAQACPGPCHFALCLLLAL